MSQVASIQGFQSVPTTTISGAGTTNGKWVSARSIHLLSFLAVWTGTLNGTIAFRVSNSPPDGANPAQPPAGANTALLTLPASFAAGNPNGAAGSFAFEFPNNVCEVWIRPEFTWVSGSGNLTIEVGGKS